MRRRGLRIFKILVGVAVLFGVAFVAARSGMATIQDIFNSHGQSKLARFAKDKKPTLYPIPGAGITLALPSAPAASINETVHFFGGATTARRYISQAGKSDSVQIVWFDMAPAALADKPSALAAIGAFQAADFSGTVTDANSFTADAAPAYECKIVQKHVAKQGPYYLRLLLNRNRVYIVRIQTAGDGDAARRAVTKGFTFNT